MITIKFFGIMRLKSGVKMLETDAADTPDAAAAFKAAVTEAKRLNPDTEMREKDLKNCLVIINGRSANKKSRLSDGDEVMFMTPSSGG